MQEKIISTMKNFDIVNHTITLDISFLTPNQIELLQKLYTEQTPFTIVISSQVKKLKTYKQLRTYFMLLHQILVKSDIPITKENIQALDRYIMENLFPCATLELNGQIIKCPPSKRFLSIEEFNELIKIILDTFSYLDLRIENF